MILGRLDAVHVRHLDVHEDDVGPRGAGQVDRLGAVARLADHLVPFFLEHLAQVHADERLVFGDQDAHGVSSPQSRSSSSGTRMVTVAPAPSPWSAVSEPRRSSSTRVRTMLKPRPRLVARSKPSGGRGRRPHGDREVVAVAHEGDGDAPRRSRREGVLERVVHELRRGRGPATWPRPP